MVHRSFTSDLAELPDSGRALRVIVGWDSLNTEAVEFAAWLGRSLPVKVQVVSAVESKWKKPLSEKKYRKWFKERATEFDHQARKVLKEYVPRAQWAKDASCLTDRADVAGSLYQSAEEFTADLIVLGSRAKTAKNRFRPSSVADALMHSSPVPLGLAPKGVSLSRKGITRVTYALVESSKSAAPKGAGGFSGLPYATTLACVLGVPLRIIAFSPSEQVTDISDAAAEWNETTLGLLDRARDQAFGVATAIDPRFADTFDVESFVASGKGWKRSIDSVKWKKGDVMCIGSQPSDNLKRVFVGTREGEFIRFAPVPVIIYPRGTN
ncbi:Universal stress protein family protein [Corynebacterium glaucum]|uniref:Universal stress protein family protein n=1 Tax=Corynebacterium glaucum TaxID=187491 RepID=A0A1Q2HZR5_9CORY|nr:universal stress protein [Corynebacterium glaucum]AQQ16319.1 Universal stress protein family protein [Corynebacterium glaucum]